MSHKLPIIAILAATALIQAGPGFSATPAPSPGASSDAAARGLKLAERNCSQCHAIGATGKSPNPLSPPFRDLHRRYPADSLGDAFARGLLTRHPSMPQMRFMPNELADLTAYFKAMRGRGQTEASAERPNLWRVAQR